MLFHLEILLYPCSLYSDLFNLYLILNLNQFSALELTKFFYLDQNLALVLDIELELGPDLDLDLVFSPLQNEAVISSEITSLMYFLVLK